jgi:hypothetical protein
MCFSMPQRFQNVGEKYVYMNTHMDRHVHAHTKTHAFTYTCIYLQCVDEKMVSPRTHSGHRTVKFLREQDESEEERGEESRAEADYQDKMRSKLASTFDDAFDVIFPSLLLWASPKQGVHIRRCVCMTDLAFHNFYIDALFWGYW